MSSQTRRVAIEQMLESRGEVDLATLAAEFSVSEMTIRRDLEALQERGVARRVRGGAISIRGSGFERAFELRSQHFARGKTAIAREVVRLFNPGDTIVFDGGSTVLQVAREARGRSLGLTVVTPSLPVALELANEPDTRVLLAGGLVRPGELSLIGSEAEQSLRQLNCDIFVLGVAGVDAERGLTDSNREEGLVKRAAISSSRRVVAAVDLSKFGNVCFMSVAAFSEIDVLVTDADRTNPVCAAAIRAGCEFVHAKPLERS